MIFRATRRDLLRYGSLTALASLPAPAIAQSSGQGGWPAKPIKIVCTYPAGGLTDIFARVYGEYVAEKTGQAVIVENKAGAAGAIGAEIVKQSPPDGYTLMFTNSTTMVQNKALFKKLPYDPDKDFALVAWFNTGHLPTMVNKDIPAKNVAEFVAWAQGRKVSLATYGIGSFAHVVVETLNRHYGLKMEAVHYRGEALMWQDVASGAVQGATGSYASGAAVLQAHSVRPIAVPTMVRMKRMPDVATFYEQGLTEKAFQIRGWVGCAAPAGTPPEVVQNLSALMVEAGKTERIRKVNETFAIDEGARDAAYFRRVLDDEGPVSIEVIKSLGIEPQ